LAVCISFAVGISGSAPQASAATLQGRIAYSTYELTGGSPSSVQNVYVSAPDGSRRRLLARDATDPVWSRDGRWLAYVHKNHDIRRVRADGRKDRLVAPGGTSTKAQPVWSPDGKWLAYRRTWEVLGGEYPEPRSVIYVVRRDGTGARRLHSGTGGSGPAWSADGHVIAFTYQNMLAAVQPNGDRLRILHRGVNPQGLEFSPVARKLVFSDYTITPPAVRTFDMSTRKLITARQAVFRDNVGLPPENVTWMPDGKRLAFFLGHWLTEGGEITRIDTVALHIARPDGSGHRQLATFTPEVGSELSWASGPGP
jgi:Tol biopolymer transport system component